MTDLKDTDLCLLGGSLCCVLVLYLQFIDTPSRRQLTRDADPDTDKV